MGRDKDALSPAGAGKTVGASTSSDDGEEPVRAVSVGALFRYADGKDLALMTIGSVAAAGVGVSLPLFSIILGGLFDDFQAPGADIQAAGRKYALLFGLIAVGTFVAAFLQIACFTIASERQTLRIRSLYLNAILTQDITWFDLSKSGELVSTYAVVRVDYDVKTHQQLTNNLGYLSK